MKDRFHGRVWIFWAQALILGGIGLPSVILGPMFWLGAIKDANGKTASDAGPPMVIIGCGFLAVALFAVFNIVRRLSPIIQCFREGIECNLVGATYREDGILLPGMSDAIWAIVSLDGFRSHRLRMTWADFGGAHVSGDPMAYLLVLRGKFMTTQNDRVAQFVAVEQAALVDHPQQVAVAVNNVAVDITARAALPSWATPILDNPYQKFE